MRRYGRVRRCVQGAFALLFLALPLARSARVHGTAIALHAGGVDVLEPASALSALVASRGAGLALAAVLLGALPLVAATLSLGSVYCGWLCPYGLLSEALDRLRRGGAARWTGRPWIAARRVRIAALAALLAASAVAATPLAALVEPPRVLSALPVEALAGGWPPALALALLGAAILVDLLGPRRILCRALCPAGGLAALLRARLTWRPRLDAARCACPASPACLTACRWGLDPREMAPRDGCTSCLACVERCPSGALRLSRPRAPARA